ncbi:MAG TPA: hypothetical protein VE913_06360, partial [Longimicrobium sp.]|nr:hypothetical protein [Longimicrobium sp.]
MRFLVTLLRELPARSPWAVQAHVRLADGSARTWPVTVHPDHGTANLVVESERDMLVAEISVRTLVAHYAEPPTREERQISVIRA